MNLSFRQLQTFVEVMRTGSVSEAGRSLGRTQPAVSAMISGLEREIGFPLFERERGRLIARPEAHYFLEEAEFVLERLSHSARTLQEIGNLEKGKLRIACNPAASGFFMPKVVAGFLRERPQVEVSLMMQSSVVITDWIASQQYDIGLAETSEPRRTIRAQNFAFPGLCAMPVDDPLTARKVITPADLDGRPLAMLYDDHVTAVQTYRAFRDAGVRLNRRFELRTFLPALQLVSEGLCCAICDSFTAISHEETFGRASSIVFRPFEPEVKLDLSLMTPANRPLSMLVQEFAAELAGQLAELAARRDW
ncbi:LysR substrate-binding domain-containing protein [Stappia sp. 28M-7]|uniref:LysR substrate-binding domain-containing protein n=1 Tax=Stappia sp. 28M-7 TaxID=2762596 RepID=UPI00163BE2F2|nr:LysR substrate-binding domain-containing protein [Stappia sp. 28M-7]MBC2859993.1 LysR family transcriptional regulator [Stappia sp. 28M-7]